MRSGVDHTVLPANHTTPAFNRSLTIVSFGALTLLVGLSLTRKIVPDMTYNVFINNVIIMCLMGRLTLEGVSERRKWTQLVSNLTEVGKNSPLIFVN